MKILCELFLFLKTPIIEKIHFSTLLKTSDYFTVDKLLGLAKISFISLQIYLHESIFGQKFWSGCRIGDCGQELLGIFFYLPKDFPDCFGGFHIFFMILRDIQLNISFDSCYEMLLEVMELRSLFFLGECRVNNFFRDVILRINFLDFI